MPFYDDRGDPLDRVFLVQRSPRHFQLLRPISFLEAGAPEQDRVQIPAHDIDRPAVGDNQTDLASVPSFLWGLIASYGRQTSAALLHDHLCVEARHGDPVTSIPRRRVADRLFRTALTESRISLLRAGTMWAFVSIEKFAEFRRWQAWLMIAHAVLATAFLYVLVGWALVGQAIGLWGFFSPFEPWMLVLALAPAVSTALWWRDAVALLVVSHVGAVVLPFMLSAALAQLVLFVLEGVVWLVSGRRSPAPVFGPTVLPRARRVP